MKNVPFKPRAYEKAALALESLDEQAAELYAAGGVKALLKIPGVGPGIADHIEELIKTGRLKKYSQMKKRMPVNLTELTSIEGIGAKTAKALYQKLKIKNLQDLKKAAVTHRLAATFGKKTEENILKALDTQDSFAKRYLLGEVFPLVEKLRQNLADSHLFQKLEVGGSFRRRQETVGDIDVLAVAKNPARAMDYFVKHKDAARVMEHGKTKSVIKLGNGMQVDLRIVPSESWGAALQYFTGDKTHNIKMRKIAIAKRLKLSEYGITPHSPPSRGGKRRGVVKFSTEEEVYRTLGMDYIEPELRTDSGEIEAAQARRLPKLINYGDVRGDLQVQTNWTDGNNSILEMAEAALKLGREYIAITDHTKTLYVTGGLDERKLLSQMREIDRVNSKFIRRGGQKLKFRVLKGAEVNILKDGSLDIDDKILAKLDVVGVSIHSHFKMGRIEQTKRIVRAMSNRNVDILFHPTTRIIQRREPIDFDFAEILKAAKEYRIALEINAYPDRLDLHDKMIRQAVEAGAKLVINTDAHSVKHLNFIHFGEAQARRGWAIKNDVLNTKPVDELLKHFKK